MLIRDFARKKVMLSIQETIIYQIIIHINIRSFFKLDKKR